ncbi:MAG: NAD-dependent epimerase/dehydratase [Parcubacteria group bacterium GW2011_GWA2_47_8]|nr:MAG: NAD-dependent epimerase/dehydratase [Parcubacteria group bacterium GW2011_GWA2_47_8]
MNILVTGGAGFIGSNLVELLVKKHPDAAITVVDNFHTGHRNNLKHVAKQVTIVEGAVEELDRVALPSTCKHIDQIYHLGIYSSSPMYKENPLLVGKVLNGMIQILELARKHKAPVVWASSSSVYNGVKPPHREDAVIDVTDFYTEARLACERLALLYNKLHGVRSIGMRFFSVYGPHEKHKGRFANIISQFLWEMEQGHAPVVYGDGSQRRDFTFVTDIVEGFWLAMQTKLDYEIINLGTATNYSFNEVIEAINTQLGTSIQPQYIGNPIKNYVPETNADITKMQRLLKFTPRVKLAEGLKRIAELPLDER